MNCTTFQKRLPDLIENNISYDLKDAMLKHIEECEQCSNMYLKEVSIEDTFRKAFDCKEILFTSSRTNIMKNIDKSRYSKNPIKKLYFHFKKYKSSYASCAALLVIGVFAVSYLGSTNFNFTRHNKNAPHSQVNTKSLELEKAAENGQRIGAPNNGNLLKKQIEGAADAKSSQEENLIVKYFPEFSRINLSKGAEPKFATSWRNSLSSKLSACIEGKGPDASEEGVGKIYIRDLTTMEEWSLQLTGELEQNSPKDILWVDDDNFLTIVGLGYGMVSRGGAIYFVNAKTGAAINADPTQTVPITGIQEISKIASVAVDKGMGKIHVEITVHDEAMTKIVDIRYADIPFSYNDIKKEIMPED